MSDQIGLKKVVFAAVAAIVCAGAQAAVDYYVNLDPTSVPGYNPEATLGSAANPFQTILQAADVAEKNDVIHVANGHYHLNGETINLEQGVRVVGESRDGVIIDGDGRSRCIKTAPDVILRDFTVTNGFLSVTAAESGRSNYGAGIWIGRNNQVSNCVVRGSLVQAGAAGLEMGAAALFCQDTATIHDSVFEYNVTSNNYNNAKNGSAKIFGGAIYGGTHYNCRVSHNRAYLNRDAGYNNFDGGAAKYGSWYGCTFTSNATVSIAGTYCARGGALGYPTIVSNCTFIGNRGDGRGTAACSSKGSIFDSTFIGNYTGVEHGGGALLLEGVRASGCWFEGNTATSTEGDDGRGVALGINGSNNTVENCVFYRNTCNSDNAILAAGTANNVISNCFFVENTDVTGATADTRLIGTGSNRGREIRVINCIFTDNIGQSAKFSGIKGTAVRGFEVHNCLFARNKFVDAIYLEQWSDQKSKVDYYDHDEKYFNSYVSNCTIVDNWLSGKAVWLFYSKSNNWHGWYDQFLRNCLIYGNYSDEGKTKFADSQLAYTEDGIYSQPWWKATNFVVNCAIDSRMTGVANLTNETAATVYGNHGNIAIEDPKFTDAANGDYTLQRKSPCVGAGTNMTWCASAVALNGMTYEHDYAKPGVRVFFNLHKPVPRVVGTAPSIGCCEYYCPPGLMLLIW